MQVVEYWVVCHLRRLLHPRRFSTYMLSILLAMRISSPAIIAQVDLCGSSTISPQNLQNLNQITQLGRGEVTDIDWSPNGSTVVAATTAGVWLLGVTTPELSPVRLEGHIRRVNAVDYDPTGELLASASSDLTVQLWAISTRETVATLQHDAGVYNVLFSPDGTLLATASGLNTTNIDLQIWNVRTGELLLNLWEDEDLGGTPQITFSTDGSFLASTRTSYVDIWDVNTGELIKTLENPVTVRDIFFMPETHYLISNSEDNIIRIWNTASDSVGRTFQITNTIYSPIALVGNSSIAINNGDNVVIWDYITNTQNLFPTPQQGIVRVISDPTGSQLALVNSDGTIIIWNISLAIALATFHDFLPPVTDIALNVHNDLIAATYQDGRVVIWNPVTGEQLFSTMNLSAAYSVSINDNGLLAYGGASTTFHGTIQIWNYQQQEQLMTIDIENSGEQGNGVREVEFSPIGNILVYTNIDFSDLENSFVKLLRISDEAHSITLDSGNNSRGIEFSENGSIIAFATIENPLTISTIHLLNTEYLRTIGKIRLSDFLGTSIALSPDASSLAVVAGNPASIRVYAVGDQTQILDLADIQVGSTSQIAFIPNELMLISSTDNPVADGEYGFLIWDLTTAEIIDTFEGHLASIESIEVNHEGTVIASGSADGTVRLWGVPSCTVVP